MIRPARHKMCFDAMQKNQLKLRSRFLSNFRVIGLIHTYVYLLLCVDYEFVIGRTYDFQLTRSKVPNPANSVRPLVIWRHCHYQYQRR